MSTWTVGDPIGVAIPGNDELVPFYPIVDTRTGETETAFPLYRAREDAERAAREYSNYLNMKHGVEL